MRVTPIGIIHTPFQKLADMPIQPSGAQGVAGQIELNRELSAGLQDLDGFSHIFVLYRFHKATRSCLSVTPFLDTEPHGVFATRAPTRPNPIGLSVLELKGVRDNILQVEHVDMLDGTPLLHIKPYVPEFDTPRVARTGWLEKAEDGSKQTRSDSRFT